MQNIKDELIKDITIEGRRILVFKEPLPQSINGAAFPDENYKKFFLVLNENKTAAEQRHTIGHELAHILLGHLDPENSRKVKDLEQEAELRAPEFFEKYGADLI